MAVDMKAVEEKLAKGEALTADETREVMSEPPEGTSNILPAGDDIPEEDFHDDTKPVEKEAKDKEVADKAVADKKVADEKAAQAPKDQDPLGKINKQLEQPEGKEDLSDLTEREKAYFWEMRRDRKRAQTAEQERDALRFEKAKKLKEEKEAKDKAEEDVDPFKDRDPNDPLTVKDLQALQAQNKKKTVKDTDGFNKNVFDANSPLVASALKYQDEVARKEIGTDYDETVECSNEIISNNPTYLRQLAEALVKGENVAKLTYTLIKGDPEYKKTLPVAKARLKAAGKKTSDDAAVPATDTKKADEDKKKKEALEAQEKLEANDKKKKTSAHVDGSAPGGLAAMGEYTVDQLLSMSDKDFSKVPKKVRDAFLKQSGV